MHQILKGGQLMLGPQLDALGRSTKLVTITSGGNDVGYIGDLNASSGDMGRLAAWLHGATKPAEQLIRTAECCGEDLHL